MPVLRAGAGSRPGGRGTFLCFAKEKYPKERRPPVCDPFAVRRGKPAPGRLRGAPWNSLCCCAAPLGQPRRVRARSMGASTPMPPRNHPAAGAASRGVDSRTATRAIASLGPTSLAQVPRAAQTGPSNAMARMDVRWVPFCACREAQGRGCVRVPKDTRTSCTDLPQLFERSAQRAVSSAAHPLTEHRRLPAA